MTKICKCGNKLKRGASTFCSNACRAKSTTEHGLRSSRQWSIWLHMKQRCDNPKNNGYKDYGGRGITYDKKWIKFVDFWEDMNQGYNDTLTIERVDVNGNYCKENCKWIPRSEQNKNQRSNLKIIFRKKEYKLFDLATQYGIKYTTLYNRLFIYKIPIEQAIKKGRVRRNTGLVKNRLYL